MNEHLTGGTRLRSQHLECTWLREQSTGENQSRGASGRDAIEESLRRLEVLSGGAGDYACPLLWLSRAECELRDLQPKLLDHLSACANEWSDLTDGAETDRALLLIPLERFFQRRADHLRVLDGLLADIRAAGLGIGFDMPSLTHRLRDWVRGERKLGASEDDFLYRPYWDDIGGEA